MKKRLLSLLLALVMLVGMIPATTLTAFAAAGGEVYVGGVAMYDGDYLAVGATETTDTQPSGGYAYYNDGTLTLNNYSYEGKGYLYSSDGYYATVFARHDLTVELVGTNTLTQTAEKAEVIQVWTANLTVDGNGKLIGTSKGSGLYATGNLTINGGTIAVTSYKTSICANYALTINGGNVTAISDNSYAIVGGTSLTIAKDLNIQASTTADGELGEYTAANHNTYKKIVITPKPRINNVNVSATFSGTPAKATTSTTGATVTATTWYRKNGSGWTELGASDTIKEDYTYRCEVTVGATGDYVFADGYTVKINGTAATKKSGNTWYRDVTITGYTSYVDVYDIALPETFINPDFTYNDEEGATYHWDVVQVEWFECDKDGHILSGALTENDLFKKDTYYRIEVTVVPETNWQFHGSNLSFYINDKAANYLYGYNKAYPDSVTGWKVYHVDDANGTYTVQIGNITLKDGDYLANNATAVTSTKPSGGYAYYKDGVLTLNNFVSKNLIRYYERYLEVELIGENKIGAIADYYYWDGNASNDYYTGLEFCGDGDLEFGEYYDYPNSNISVNGNVFFNGSGNIILDADFYCFKFTDNVIINDGYVSCYCAQSNVFKGNANITVNGGKLKMLDGGSWDDYFICDGDLSIHAGSVYVSADPRKIELEDCVPWDGVTDLNTYDCVWIVPKHEIYVGGVYMYDGDYLAVGATTTQTTKPSGGYAYYKDSKLTLNNYSYEGVGYKYNSDDDYYAVIYTENDLTLELIGNNTLTQTDFDSDMIYVYGASLTVGGDGKLTGTPGGYALYADKDITINGGTVEVSTYFTSIVSHGEVIINDGDITVESEGRTGIYSRYDVTVNGGNVTAIGGDGAIDYESSGSFTVAEGMNIQASTTVAGELGEYVAANHDSYKKIVVHPDPEVYVVGDVNADGLVNAKDVLLLRKCIAAGSTSSLDLKVADVNGDGDINAKDVVKLRRKVAGGYNE